MPENKTIPTTNSVIGYIELLENKAQKTDSYTLIELMKEISQKEPILWGDSIIGFGSYHYKYKSGREGDMMLLGFSPRKTNFSIYIMNGFESYQELLKKLGKHKTGKSCLYLKNLAAIDFSILKELLADSYSKMNSN